MGAKHDEGEAALRPLRRAAGAVEALRGGAADAEARRSGVMQVTAAIEASLRRLLRDDPHVPLELRLRALARDELSTEEMVAELRRRDRISIELAAAFHDLAARARGIRQGAPAEPEDAELALRLVERLEWEAAAPPPAPVPTPEEPVFAEEDPLVHPVPPASRARHDARVWGAVALTILLMAALAFWIRESRRDDRSLAEGIALFRQGNAAAAVAQFERYAQANPDDPTPRIYLARIHRRAGRLEESREQILRGLRAAPEDPGLQRELGFLLLDAGRPADAVERFRSAVLLDPDSVEGWIGLIRALRAAGREDAAQRVLATAPPEVRALLTGARQPGTPTEITP